MADLVAIFQHNGTVGRHKPGSLLLSILYSVEGHST